MEDPERKLAAENRYLQRTLDDVWVAVSHEGDEAAQADASLLELAERKNRQIDALSEALTGARALIEEIFASEFPDKAQVVQWQEQGKRLPSPKTILAKVA